MTTAIYLRISDDETGEAEGVERQREDCEALIERNGWTLGTSYVDNDESAWGKNDRRRPGFRRMLADASAGQFDRLVVWKLDRLTRGGMRTLGKVLDTFEPGGITLVSVTEAIDTSTPMGEAVAGVLAAVAKQASDDTSLRVKRAAESKFARGEWKAGGERKFGFVQDRTAHVPEEAKAIRWAVKNLLDGGTLHQVAVKWNRSGLHRDDFRSTHVRQILLSPSLSGRMVRGDQVAPAPWKPIVSVEDHDELLDMLNARTEGPTGPRTVKHLLTGLVRCTCGAMLTASPDPTRNTTRYKCMVPGGRGAHVSAYGKNLEPEVERRFLAMIDRPDFAATLREAAKRHLEASSGDAKVSRELQLIDRKLDEIRDAYAGGRLDFDEMLALRERLSERRKAVVAGSPGRVAQVDLGALEGVSRTWEGLEINTKRRILRSTVDISLLPGKAGKTFNPDRVVIDLKVGLF